MTMRRTNLLPILFVALIVFTACNKEESENMIRCDGEPSALEMNLFFVNEAGEDLFDKNTEGYLLGENRGADVKAFYNKKQYPLMLKDDVCREDTLYSSGYLYYLPGWVSSEGTTTRNRLCPFYVCKSRLTESREMHYMRIGSWSRGDRWIDKEIVLDWGEGFKRDTLLFTWYVPTEGEHPELTRRDIWSGPLSLKFNGEEVTNRDEDMRWYIIERK